MSKEIDWYRNLAMVQEQGMLDSDQGGRQRSERQLERGRLRTALDCLAEIKQPELLTEEDMMVLGAIAGIANGLQMTYTRIRWQQSSNSTGNNSNRFRQALEWLGLVNKEDDAR